MTDPLVTILIACYNHQDYVEQSIRSALDQTYKNLQLIVVDDSSTDNSIPVIEKLHVNNDFILIKNPVNLGLNNSIVKSFEFVKGEYFSLLASDDYITPNKIEEQINYLQQNELDGVYANGYALSGNKSSLIKLNKIFNNYDQSRALKYICQYDWEAPLIQSGLFKTNVVLHSVDIRKQYKSDDWAFSIVVLQTFKIGFINKPYFFYRLHNTNTHKNYWTTLPMRVDIASRLVPAEYRIKTLSNIFLFQGRYLLLDKEYFKAFKFFLSSLSLSFSFKKMFFIVKSYGILIKNKS